MRTDILGQSGPRNNGNKGVTPYSPEVEPDYHVQFSVIIL